MIIRVGGGGGKWGDVKMNWSYATIPSSLNGVHMHLAV